MVTMSLLGAGGPKAAMAQATADNDALQAIGIETGGNTQANVAEVEQEAENNIEISSEAESEAEAETSVEDSVIVANNEQNAEVNQANVLEDNDDVTVDATQVAVQDAIAADVDIGELLVLLGLAENGPIME